MSSPGAPVPRPVPAYAAGWSVPAGGPPGWFGTTRTGHFGNGWFGRRVPRALWCSMDVHGLSEGSVHDQFDVSLEDADLLGEVELTTNLIIAASEVDEHLSQAEIDAILGVVPHPRAGA